jgi:hypothetical protein
MEHAMKTLAELIAARGIDEAKAARRLKRNAYYDMHKDRMKVFASTPLNKHPMAVEFGRMYFKSTYEAKTIAVDIGALIHAGNTGNTKLYVAAWCRLNHLKA